MTETRVTTDDREPSTKMPAVTMAVLVLAGFGLAIAGLAPTAGAQSPCDATVTPTGSIQAAVNAANQGDRICVLPGTYVEDVTVGTDDVVLLGPNAGVPAEVRAPAVPATEATINGHVTLMADGVDFVGFEVTPPPATSGQNAEAILVTSPADGVDVEYNVVHDFSENGLGNWEGVEGIVAFGGDDSDPIEVVEISGNAIYNIEGKDSNGGAAGIMIQGNVDGASVRENVAFNIGQQETAWAQGVVVTHTSNHGVVPDDVDISGNELSRILSKPSSATYGVGVGIETDGTNYVIEDNRILENEYGVEVKAGAGQTTVAGNAIQGNAVYGATNTDTASLDATDNWWGSPLGPTHSSNPNPGALTGDTINGNVAFSPWCQDPACAT